MAGDDGNRRPLQFVRVRSEIDVGFWCALSEKVLAEWQRESSRTVAIIARYDVRRNPFPEGPLITIDANGFTGSDAQGHRAPGTLMCFGTYQQWSSWVAHSTQQSLQATANMIWDDIASGAVLEKPALLARFVLAAYPDLKQHKFHYLFGIPAIAPKLPLELKSSEPATNVLTHEQCGAVSRALTSGAMKDGFFAVDLERVAVLTLAQYDAVASARGTSSLLLAMVDLTSRKTGNDNPCWLFRNFATLIARTRGAGEYRFLCIRSPDAVKLSVVLTVVMEASVTTSDVQPVGWERNVKGPLVTRTVDLGSLMNPQQLASSGADLNLRLMKWRQFPGLNLERLSSLKVLILGAGTLGCNVARNLAAWGVRQFAFIDNGRVAHSNPVRQSLFRLEDCLNGGMFKVEAAARAMQDICPSISAKGVALTIPMVGHPVSDKNASQCQQDFVTLTRCVEEADVVFLLTDSRESRWLPTVIARAKNVSLVNCALGFDTFVVMRHSTERDPGIGCYFCADVTAPADSLSDRSLDQQCTVTRPGVSPWASAIAVELYMALLHRNGGGESELGLCPSQIRGWVSRYETRPLTTNAFDKCIACSPPIVQAFVDRGWDFVLEAVNNPDALEEHSGLAAMKRTVEDHAWELESVDSDQ
ncbi:Autophagy-related protein 7 [Plasmodiophora brassicae]